MSCANYKTYRGSECLLACFTNIIKYNNLGIEESDIFLFGDGLKTRYRKSLKDDSDAVLTGGVHNSVFEFCRDNKLKVYAKESLSSEDYKNEMLYYLSRDMPVTLKVDPGYLKYSPIYTNGFGLTHYINIIDYDTQNDSVLLSDGFIPTSPPSVYQNWYSYELIRKSGSLKNYFYFIFDISRLKDGKLLQNKIKENYCHKLRDNLTGYLNGYEDSKFAYGIQALRRFSEDVPVLLDLLGERFSDWMFKLNYNMKIYGLISGKVLLYKALERLACDRDSNMIRMLMDESVKVVDEWNKISMLVVKSGLIKSKESLVLLSDKIKAVALREEKVYGKILACI